MHLSIPSQPSSHRHAPTAVRLLTTLVASTLLLLAPSRPQQSPQNGTNTPRPAYEPPSMSGELPPSVAASQARARNDDRQKHLVADTEKLLALATQLHEDVAKTNKNVLSLDVVHRADEIEKLAHSVKEHMKG